MAVAERRAGRVLGSDFSGQRVNARGQTLGSYHARQQVTVSAPLPARPPRSPQRRFSRAAVDSWLTEADCERSLSGTAVQALRVAPCRGWPGSRAYTADCSSMLRMKPPVPCAQAQCEAPVSISFIVKWLNNGAAAHPATDLVTAVTVPRRAEDTSGLRRVPDLPGFVKYAVAGRYCAGCRHGCYTGMPR
jgi:hypothetical protein